MALAQGGVARLAGPGPVEAPDPDGQPGLGVIEHLGADEGAIGMRSGVCWSERSQVRLSGVGDPVEDRRCGRVAEVLAGSLHRAGAVRLARPASVTGDGCPLAPLGDRGRADQPGDQLAGPVAVCATILLSCRPSA